MRATAPAMKATDVWDVLLTAIVGVGSIGELLKTLGPMEVFEIDESVGAGVSYTPPANCVITGYDPNAGNLVLEVQDTANNWRASDLVPTAQRYNQDVVACDGAVVRFHNGAGGAITMTAEAWRYA